jgi:hypothetical protein
MGWDVNPGWDYMSIYWRSHPKTFPDSFFVTERDGDKHHSFWIIGLESLYDKSAK